MSQTTNQEAPRLELHVERVVAYGEAGAEFILEVTDEGVAAVHIKQELHTPESWDEFAAEIARGFAMMFPEKKTDEATP